METHDPGQERGKGREWRSEATPTGRGYDPETLHHPSLGPNRERASGGERSHKVRPRDERRERGRDHGGHGSGTPAKASQGMDDGSRSLPASK